VLFKSPNPIAEPTVISVIIPAYNEEDAITYSIEAVMKTLMCIEGVDSEIIVIDDGSSDQTSQLAKAAGAKVIRNPHNMGYGFSLKAGIRAAKFDTIAITDADGTYPIAQLPNLLNQYAKGFNMVVGCRTGKYYRESFLKMPLRIILKALVEFAVGRKIPDINSGFRIFSKEDILPYFNHLCDSFSFTTSMTLAYMMTGKFVSYEPIDYHKRIGKTKIRLFRDSLKTLQFIVQAILYYNPIKIFLVMCGLTLSFAVLCFAMSALFGLLSGFILGVGSVLMTILIFALGLLADLLRQIMVKP
jgi:polyisoprenyl-phosphate glycosyltransferase